MVLVWSLYGPCMVLLWFFYGYPERSRRQARQPTAAWASLAVCGLTASVIGESHLRRSLASDAEDEGLSFLEAFAQLKVLEGNTAGDGAARLPIGVAGVDGYVQIVASRPPRLLPILGHLEPAVVPELAARKRVHRRGIFLIGRNRHQHVSLSCARQAVERIHLMRGEALAGVIGVKLEAAYGFVLEPEEPGAGQVAHRGGQDAVVQRGTAGIGLHGQPDLIRRVAALGDQQPHVRAVIEAFNLHWDIKLLDARRWPKEPSGHQERLRRARGDVGFADRPKPFAARLIQCAGLQFTEAPPSIHNWFDGNEVDQIVSAIGRHRVANPNRSEERRVGKE